MHSGARRISVDHVTGWGQEFARKASAGIPQVNVEAGISNEWRSSKTRQILYEAELDGKDSPLLPERLAWYQHEPTWQAVAEGRLGFGLKSFSLQLQYNDDFGVNGGLKVRAEKVGF